MNLSNGVLGWCVVLSLSGLVGCAAHSGALVQYALTNVASEIGGRAVGGALRPSTASSAGFGPVSEANHGSIRFSVQEVKTARWTEIKFQAENIGDRPLTITSIEGVDTGGVYRSQIMNGVQKTQAWDDNTNASGLNSVGMGAIVLGSMIPYPVRFFGSGIQNAMNGNVAQEDRRLQETQIQRITLAAGGSVSGSAYFPPGDYKQVSFAVSSGREYESFIVSLSGNKDLPRVKHTPIKNSVEKEKGEKIFIRTKDGYVPVT
jgi:hypothetical protein